MNRGEIYVRQTAGQNRHYWIENTPEDQWEANHVMLSGFVGRHNPNTFAAAPDLLVALQGLLTHSLSNQAPAGQEAVRVARAAIAKATAAIGGA